MNEKPMPGSLKSPPFPSVLDLGCGNKKRPGSLGLDVIPGTQADVIHDLSVFPYPFPDSTFSEIFADNVLEHLDSPLKVMEELHRICRPGAKVTIIVPYFRSKWAFADPTHRSFFAVDSFSYTDPDHPFFARYAYSKAAFKVVQKVFNEGLVFSGPLKYLIHGLTRYANKWPHRYEFYLSHLFPLDQLTFELRAIKAGQGH